MDTHRLQFLFGVDALKHLDEYDLDNESDVMEAIERFAPMAQDAENRDFRTTLRTVAVTQVLANDPPETWEAVERLGGVGF